MFNVMHIYVFTYVFVCVYVCALHSQVQSNVLLFFFDIAIHDAFHEIISI